MKYFESYASFVFYLNLKIWLLFFYSWNKAPKGCNPYCAFSLNTVFILSSNDVITILYSFQYSIRRSPFRLNVLLINWWCSKVLVTLLHLSLQMLQRDWLNESLAVQSNTQFHVSFCRLIANKSPRSPFCNIFDICNSILILFKSGFEVYSVQFSSVSVCILFSF